jgi:hypothetical protein
MVSLKREYIIIHCAATPDYEITSPYFDRFGAGDIDVWHRQQGWSQIGYNFVIRRTGVIEAGRSLDIAGAHTLGYNNNPGVCYIGTKNPTEMQLQSLANLCYALLVRFGLKKDKILPHNYFNSGKICPGFDLNRFISLIK